MTPILRKTRLTTKNQKKNNPSTKIKKKRLKRRKKKPHYKERKELSHKCAAAVFAVAKTRNLNTLPAVVASQLSAA